MIDFGHDDSARYMNSRKPPRWVGHKGPYGRNTSWTNEAFPGVVIRHCGHPTALWPYYIEGRKHLHSHTYRTLAEAQAAAERQT